MRHSIGMRRVFALATLTALVGGTPWDRRLGARARSVEQLERSACTDSIAGGGTASLTRSGTRGVVDPKKLPEPPHGPRASGPSEPALSRVTAMAPAPAPKAPTRFPVAPDPVEVTQTGNPPARHGFRRSTVCPMPTLIQPADPWVAVGPDHVIQTVNRAMQILDRSGNLIESHTLADFFDLTSAAMGAPIRGSSSTRCTNAGSMTELSWVCLDAGGRVRVRRLPRSLRTADPTDPMALGPTCQWTNHFPDFPALGTVNRTTSRSASTSGT